MANITKEMIVEGLVDLNGISKTQAKALVDDAINLIMSELTTANVGDSIRLAPLGSFHIYKSTERTMHNVKTGKPITIKPKNCIRFKPSVRLKRELQED